MDKSSTIEYIENMYGLANNYLKNKNNIELKNLLKELEMIESKIELCNGENSIKNYKLLLEELLNRIEGIINE